MAGGPDFNRQMMPDMYNPEPGLTDIANILSANRAQRERERMDRAKNLRDQQAHEDTLARLKIQDQRAAAAFGQQQTAAKRQEAQDRVAAYDQINQRVNPRSPNYNPTAGAAIGEAWGLKGLQQQMPQQPQEPQAPPELANNVSFLARNPQSGAPVEHNDPAEFDRDQLIAQALGEGRQRITEDYKQDPNWNGPAGLAYNQKLQDFQKAQEAYPGQLEAANQNPVYQATDEHGRPVRFAPTENETAHDRVAKEAADRMRSAGMAETDPFKKQWYDTIANLLEQRQLKPEQGAGGAELNTLLANQTKANTPRSEGLTFEQRKELARIGAAPKWGMVEVSRHGSERADTEEGRKDAAAANSGIATYLTQQGFKGTVGEARDLAGISANIAKGGAALDTATAARYANIVQQRGILTDEDFSRFWQKVGDPATRSEDFLSRALTGEMGEAKRTTVKGAIEQLAKNTSARLNAIAKGADRYLEPYGGERPRIMESYFPGYQHSGGQPIQRPEAPWVGRGGNKQHTPASAQAAGDKRKAAMDWLNSPEAKADPATAAAVRKKLGL